MNRSPYLRAAFATALAIALVPAARGQNAQDALRFSFLQPQGTARSMGFGSALGSIGGDFTSLSVNPAGIGIYRRSEFTFTPSLTLANTSSDYSGNSVDDNGSRFAISNIGLVTTKLQTGRRAKGGWTSFSFGVGLTRLADFTRDYSYSGQSTASSGSFTFEADANQDNPRYHDQNVSLGDLGYQTYLLDTAAGGGFVSVVNPKSNAPVGQYTSIKERGGISEVGLTFGGAYQDKLMLGATLGFPIVRYMRSKTFTERDLSGNPNNDFDYFTYNEDLKTSGGGINLKLGFIYKATENFRFGAAVHTPTWLSLTDVQNQDMTTNTENFAGLQTARMLENQYDYSLSTPWRGVVSATALFGGHGFFTVDYEYVDYKSARFSFDDASYETDVNNTIKNTFQGASNVRAGVEVRLENLQLRGGFGYYGNPYKSGSPSGERTEFSAGIGYRFPKAFIDFGFVHRMYSSSEQPYYLAGSDTPGTTYFGLAAPTANLTTGANTAALTVGFKL